ncbi:MFS transporter [Candidatus Binatia bacterium]|nr:MFS transporter [Candidatus Binatia bacterium]
MSLNRKLFWIAVLYFAEGLPFGIVVDTLPVYFRVHGVSLTAIGLMSLLGAPWTLKVVWAPLVDRFGPYRRWILSCLALMALSLTALPLAPAVDPGPLVWALLFAFTLASATQDIAIDAYTINLLAPGEEGVANGVRLAAYRVALIVGGGGLVMLAGGLGWTAVFHAAAGLLIVAALAVARSPLLPRPPAATGGSWFRPLRDWILRPGAPAVFLFVLTYKLGDASMGPMVKPFWVDRGLSLEEIGLVSTTLGIAASIVGALAGGLLTSRWGIFTALWSLGLLQALSNLGYAGVAALDGGRPAIYAASLFESFTGGLGNAAFLAFLMHICDKERAATEYAMLSAVFGLTRSLAGAVSGLGVTVLGYGSYFAITFFLAFPAFALLPWIRGWAANDRELHS